MGSGCCRLDESPHPAEKIVVDVDESAEVKENEESARTSRRTSGTTKEDTCVIEQGVNHIDENQEFEAGGEPNDTLEQNHENDDKENNTQEDSALRASSKAQNEFQKILTYKLPLYSAGGPKNFNESISVPDPFEPPDIGNAIYLSFFVHDNGSLKLQFAKETSDVKGRIIAAGILEAEVQPFKYKQPTSLCSDIWVKTEEFYEGIGRFLKACYQYQCRTTFYPLPPDFPPFCIIYQSDDESIYIQYAGEDSFNLSKRCNVAVVAACDAVKTVKRASRIEYNLFKLQFGKRNIAFVVDFAKM